MKSGLVSIAIYFASGASRSSTCGQKVPTPGPYSTNSFVFSQSTGPSILRISLPDEGTTEPTITGCLMKPLMNIPQGEGTPAAARRRGRAAVVETVTGDPHDCELTRICRKTVTNIQAQGLRIAPGSGLHGRAKRLIGAD